MPTINDGQRLNAIERGRVDQRARGSMGSRGRGAVRQVLDHRIGPGRDAGPRAGRRDGQAGGRRDGLHGDAPGLETAPFAGDRSSNL